MAVRGGEHSFRHGRVQTCLACGQSIEAALLQLGSLRCLECRDLQRPLDPELVEPRVAPHVLHLLVRRLRRER